MSISLYSIDRKKLYKEVWKEPMIKVAVRYNISNVGLKKICKKMNIPVPGPGHWAKVRAGAEIEKPPLPKYDGPELAKKKTQTSTFFDDFEFSYEITKYTETRKFEQLKSEALDWQLAMTIRDYTHAVESRVLPMRMSQSEKLRIRRLIKWAKQKADWLDPITAVDDPILRKKLYKRLFFDEE